MICGQVRHEQAASAENPCVPNGDDPEFLHICNSGITLDPKSGETSVSDASQTGPMNILNQVPCFPTLSRYWSRSLSSLVNVNAYQGSHSEFSPSFEDIRGIGCSS